MTEQEKVQQAISYIDPALVEAVELNGRKRRMSAPLRAGLVAACVCLALVGTGLAVERILNVQIVDFTGDGEGAGYQLQLNGIRGVPLDSLPEELLTASRLEGVDFATTEEAQTALGLELAGFAPFENGADREELHFKYNDGPVRHTHCTLNILGSMVGPNHIDVTAAYATYLSGTAPKDFLDRIYFYVTACIYTEEGLQEYDGPMDPWGLWMGGPRDTEFTQSSFMAPDGQEVPVISAVYPVSVLDEQGLPIDTVEGNSVYAYYVMDGILYKVSVSGTSGVDVSELQPTLEHILGGTAEQAP